MFEVLFKYSAETFARSEFIFASGWPVALLVALCAVAAVAVGVVIQRRRTDLHWGKAATLGGLQVALLSLLLVLAWRPALVTQTLRPQENGVALLLDTSGSMAYADGGGTRSRLQTAIENLAERALPELERTFEVRKHAFSGETIELPSLDRVPEPGPVTHVYDALLDVLRGSGSGAVAAVVLVSDGADNSATLDAAKIAEIASFGVPVHTVGVGAETIPDDLELDDVQIAPTGLSGSTVSARISVRHDGRATTQLKVYDGEAIIAAETIELPDRTGITSRWIDVEVGAPGVRDLKFALEPIAGEPNVVNNERLRPMAVPEDRRQILYLEGEPRWDYKYIRRALHDIPALRLPSLVKTTPNKDYRQGLESAEELAGGIPANEDTLFAYDALIIGSFGAQEFTPEQHTLIHDFVSRRGGSLLMLAGRRGLGGGAWANTKVAEALPVVFETLDGPSFFRVTAKPVLTVRNDRLAAITRASPITRFESDDRDNAKSWDEMPQVLSIQYVGKLKPAAEVLLWGELTVDEMEDPPDADERARIESLFKDEPLPLLIHQRYGAGNVYVLATGGTWRWQMGLPHDDMRSETFWRQLTQAMATAAPRHLALSADKSFYGDETEVALRAEVRDKAFRPTADASVEIMVTDGRGLEQPVTMTPVAGEPGVYEAQFEMPRTGTYSFAATARLADEELGTSSYAVRREDGLIEHFRMHQDRKLLERIAEATGGRYFEVDDLAALPEAVKYSDAGIVERQVLDLWNMPAIFLLLLLLKGTEWLLRLFWGRL